MNCSKCKTQLPADGSYATCAADRDNCFYHFACTSISQRTYLQWGPTKRNLWICPLHRESKKGSSSQEGSPKILSQGSDTHSVFAFPDPDGEDNQGVNNSALVKYLDQKFADQADQLRQINSKFDTLQKELESQAKKIGSLEEDNKKLRSENKELRFEVDRLSITTQKIDSELRRKNLMIRGIPVTESENLKKVITDLALHLETPIEESKDIEETFRLPTRSPDYPGPILVKFTSRTKRDELLSQAFKKKPVLNNIIQDANPTPIYLNEHLSQLAADLVGRCAYLKREGRIEAFRTRKGQVYVKKIAASNFIPVRDRRDLEDIAE